VRTIAHGRERPPRVRGSFCSHGRCRRPCTSKMWIAGPSRARSAHH
jgi:hypothetical protein